MTLKANATLGDQFLHYAGGSYAGEFGVEALEFDGEAFVVDAAEVEERGVEVVHGDYVFRRAVAEFVGVAVGDAALDAAAGEEDREGVDVVIAAVALAHRG